MKTNITIKIQTDKTNYLLDLDTILQKKNIFGKIQELNIIQNEKIIYNQTQNENQ